MWRILALLALGVVLTLVAFSPHTKMYDDGLWPVSISIHSSSGRPITAVSCEVCDGPDWVQMRLDHPFLAEPSIYATVVDPFCGEPVVVRVPTAETTWYAFFWQWKRFYQYRTAVVVVRYADWHHEVVPAPLPDLRQGRELTAVAP